MIFNISHFTLNTGHLIVSTECWVLDNRYSTLHIWWFIVNGQQWTLKAEYLTIKTQYLIPPTQDSMLHTSSQTVIWPPVSGIWPEASALRPLASGRGLPGGPMVRNVRKPLEIQKKSIKPKEKAEKYSKTIGNTKKPKKPKFSRRPGCLSSN